MGICCPWGEGRPVAWHSARFTPSWDIELELNTGHAWMSVQWKISGDTWGSSRSYHPWGIGTALAPATTKAILIQRAKVRESLLTLILWDFHSAGAFGSTYNLLSPPLMFSLLSFIWENIQAMSYTIHTKVAVMTTDKMAFHGLYAFQHFLKCL